MDDLDQLSDEKLSECFAVEVAGMQKRTEGLLWDDANNRAFIIGGSSLHDVRKRMRLPCDNGVLAEFATDANAVLPWLEERAEVSNVFEDGEWFVGIEEKPARPGSFVSGKAPTFPRAACIALIRASRYEQDNPR